MEDEIGGVHWETVGAGRLALRGRPGKKLLTHFPSTGCTHVVTLLSVQEGGEMIGQMLRQQGITWTWLPLANAKTPAGATASAIISALPLLSAGLDAGESILIHCSAGIHRTGMVAYALLRWRGLDDAATRLILERLRPATANGMHASHYAWGDDIMPFTKAVQVANEADDDVSSSAS